jgi:enoyl-CoA hydratase/carnithine racemase
MAPLDDLDLTTLAVAVDEGVATVTLDRPQVHNAFDPTMVDELAGVWGAIKEEPAVRSVVLTGAGEKAFCTGLDRSSVEEFGMDPFTYEDPGKRLGPKSQGLWKPVVAAVNGMACGGAFYLLAEADVLIAAEHATFFDPHVTYGMAAVFEPILMLRRMPFGEVLRMSLAGSHERVSAATAERLGLVSEVTTADDLLPAAQRLAGIFAASPPHAVQATLRTLWAAKDLSVAEATELGNIFLQLGTSVDALNEGQAAFESGVRIEPRIR